MKNEPRRLGTVLGEQIRCAQAMLETLAQENQALTVRDQNALSAASDAKAKLVDALEQLETERRELAQAGDTSNTAEWQRLRGLIAQCKEHNQRNGTLLTARAENVRVALKTLRGAEPDLYGASGRTPSRIDARTLGTA